MIVLAVSITVAGGEIGVRSSIDLDGPVTITHGSGRQSYDEEVESAQTSFGIYGTLLSIVIGIWVGCATFKGQWSAGWSRRDQLTYRAWLVGLVILTVFSALVDLAFRSFTGGFAQYVRYLLELAAAVGVLWAARLWWKAAVAR